MNLPTGLAIATGILFLGAVGSAQVDSPSVARFVQPDFCTQPANLTLPKWSGDRLLCFKRWTLEKDEGPNLVSYDRKGREVSRARIWTEGAWKIQVRDAATAANGGLMAVGTAYSSAGQTVGFLIRTASSGALQSAVQLAPFTAYQVCPAEDGTTWLLGMRPPEDGIHLEDHNIVEHRAADGRLLAGYLSNATFQLKIHPAALSDRGIPGLACSPSSTYLFFPQTSEWIEINSWSGHISRHSVQRLEKSGGAGQPAEVRMLGFAVTPSGEVLASFQGERLGLFRLDKSEWRWRPVPAAAGPDSLTRLLGLSGNSVVYEDGAARTVGWALLHP